MWTSRFITIALAVSCNDPPSVDTLVGILKTREEALTRIAVRMKATDSKRPLLPDMTFGPMTHTSDLFEVVEESAGRCRVMKVTQRRVQSDDGAIEQDQEELLVFGGENTKKITSSLTRPICGDVRPGRESGLPFWGSIFPVITRFSTTSLPKVLEKYHSQISEYRLIDVEGRELLSVEITISSESEGSSAEIYKIALDATAGYCPIKAEAWKRTASKAAALRYSFHMSELAEVHPGLWLPGRVQYEEHAIVDGKSKRELVRKVEASFERWQINPPLEKNTFALSFPKGLQVYDAVHQTSYLAKEVDDDLIEKQVAEARRLSELYKSTPQPKTAESSTEIITMLLIVVAIVTVGTAVTVLCFRLRAKSGLEREARQ